jgi:hypothetical protein
MNDEPESPLTAAEQAAFDALPRTTALPAGLEERVAAAVGRGEARRAGPGPLRWLAAAGLAGVFFTLGYAASRIHPAPLIAPQGARYLLLLRETAEFRPPADRAGSALVAEYRTWARELRRRGALELGEQLADDGALLAAESAAAPPPADGGKIVGLFVVRAPSLAGALAMAKSCPHMRYGGRIEVRPIIES